MEMQLDLKCGSRTMRLDWVCITNPEKAVLPDSFFFWQVKSLLIADFLALSILNLHHGFSIPQSQR